MYEIVIMTVRKGLPENANIHGNNTTTYFSNYMATLIFHYFTYCKSIVNDMTVMLLEKTSKVAQLFHSIFYNLRLKILSGHSKWDANFKICTFEIDKNCITFTFINSL